MKLIATKKKAFFKEKISENIGKPKELCSLKWNGDGDGDLPRPLSEIFNLSICRGVFPDTCKVAKLKPIYKKGKKTYPSNYRPISLIPIISKVIEKIVHDQTNKFFSENNIFYNFQSGFRPNHSTNLCLAHLTDKILKGFDEGLLTGMIHIDLQKAFDIINHEVLLQKLQPIRFSERSIQWFRTFVTEYFW